MFSSIFVPQKKNWCFKLNLLITCYTRVYLHSRAGQGFYVNLTFSQCAMQKGSGQSGVRFTPECGVLSLDACAEVMFC